MKFAAGTLICPKECQYTVSDNFRSSKLHLLTRNFNGKNLCCWGWSNIDWLTRYLLYGFGGNLHREPQYGYMTNGLDMVSSRFPDRWRPNRFICEPPPRAVACFKSNWAVIVLIDHYVTATTGGQQHSCPDDTDLDHLINCNPKQIVHCFPTFTDMPVNPLKSFRSRPLPPVPGASSSASGSHPTSLAGSDALGSSPNDSDRNSTLTFTSIGTNLPRYSAIDFLAPDFSLEQVDHWNEADGSLVVVASSDTNSLISSPDSQPPEYTLSIPGPRTSSSPHSDSRRPRFVLHKFHLGGHGRKSDQSKGKQLARPPWATLKLISRSSAQGSRAKTPRFIGGDPMRGSVDLCLDAPMNVHKIKFIVSYCATSWHAGYWQHIGN